MFNIKPTKATELSFSDLAALIGMRVIVTVTDNPKQIQNGPERYAGTVENVYQHDAEGRNLHAGNGSIHFAGGLTARWTKHQTVTVTVL